MEKLIKEKVEAFYVYLQTCPRGPLQIDAWVRFISDAVVKIQKEQSEKDAVIVENSMIDLSDPKNLITAIVNEGAVVEDVPGFLNSVLKEVAGRIRGAKK